MKAVMVMFDTLIRHMLSPYGGWAQTPNFERLAERSVRFDNAYVGSMPCMPARRELHTGRYNFLHRSWGPLEPFDDSMPQILHENGIYTHLVTDHYHYFEDGGATYHGRYSSYEMVRGQEGDAWKGHVADPDIPETLTPQRESAVWKQLWRQDWVNREHMPTEADQPQPQTFELGLEFMRRNAEEDNWFLQIETFDPHEPFFTQQHYKDLYPHHYDGPFFDWAPYGKVTEPPEAVQHMRYQYAALMSMCDTYLGKVLDMMDELDMWKDTMLIVNTDHGFLLGEHDWWAKVVMPFYQEVAHVPLFIWDPRAGKRNETRDQLVQMIDIAPTLLDFFDVDIPADMQGVRLREALLWDTHTRDALIFGVHGGHVNCTDGRYMYMRAPVTYDNSPLVNYTLMPTNMRGYLSVDDLRQSTLAPPFSFTKGMPTLRIPAPQPAVSFERGSMLFDLTTDAYQQNPLYNPEVETQMLEHIAQLMHDNDAPPEQYDRLGIKEKFS